MNAKIAFFTTIFPMPECFLIDFFDSLEQQTFKVFDTIVINDGYQNFNKIKEKYTSLNIIEIPYRDTIAKNREYGINYIKENNYDILILGDSDDYFQPNRVQKSLEYLDYYDIVVNDLSLFDENGIFDEKYISERVKNKTEITLEFIRNKNIFGFSNTALKLENVPEISFDPELKAVDWYFFSRLLLENKKAIFTNETQTFYRQHDLNAVGFSEQNEEKTITTYKIKKKHFWLLKEYPGYEKLYDNILKKQDLLNIMPHRKIKHPLWWEEADE